MSPKDKLDHVEPKCANCTHIRPLINSLGPERKASFLEEMGIGRGPEDRTHAVAGKGICWEPSAQNHVTPFFVQDLGLCSLWERKP